jgi:poly-gamma-glutamate synthesis protein (capsule biosynthesis protein)
MRRAQLAGALLAAGAAAASAQPAAEPAPYARTAAAETEMKITAPFTVATVGDLIMPQPLLRSEPGFRALVDRVRSADVGFANMESSLVDFDSFGGAVYGTEARLDMGEAIKAMGFDLVSRANNHTFDGGLEGMLSTDRALDRLGIVHAGTGRNLQDARSPRSLETPKGRVGLVSFFSVDNASNFGPQYTRTLATRRIGNLGGGAGVNPLHLTRYQVVTPAQLQALKSAAQAAYGQVTQIPAANGLPERLKFYDEWFQAGDQPGTIAFDMQREDEKEILDSVRNGKVYADFLIATVHAHQTPLYLPEAPPAGPDAIPPIKEGLEHETPAFLVRLAHECIDSGADMFVVHGLHTLRGVEIYKGKPIFYGLSNFVFQFGLQLGTTEDVMGTERKLAALENPASQETVLATSVFDKGRLKEVRLYPADLGGPRRPISQMGIPQVPSPQDSQRILKAMQAWSAVFGTHVAIEDNVGVIRVREEATSQNSKPASPRRNQPAGDTR